MTTQAESMPLADYLVSHGVEPGKAATLGAEGEEISRNRGLGLRESAHPAALEELRRSTPTTHAEIQESLAAHEAAQLSQELDAAFMPPASAADYRFPAAPSNATDEYFAQVSAVKNAFFAEGVPGFIGKNLADNIDRNARTITSVHQIDARLAANEASLSRLYGADLPGNLQLVDRTLDDMARRQPALQPFVTAVRERRYLLDWTDIKSLVDLAKHTRR